MKYKQLLASLLIGGAILGAGSKVYASSVDEQIKQNQTQLTQVKQQEQSLTAQLQAVMNKITENKTKEENFSKALLKEKLDYQTLKDKISALTKKYEKKKQAIEEISNPQEYLKETNQIIDLKDQINDLKAILPKYTPQIQSFEVSVAYYQQQRLASENQRNQLATQLQQVSQQDASLQSTLQKLNQQKAEEEKQQAKQAQTQATGFASPLATNLVVSSGFGHREDPNGVSGTQHDGIDLVGQLDQSVFAARDGKVVMTGTDKSAGNYIIIQHDNGFYSYYLHLNHILVKTNDSVLVGQEVGKMGTTGNSTGVHLHFGLAHTANWKEFVDPAPYLKIS